MSDTLTVTGFGNRGSEEYPFGYIDFSDEMRIAYAPGAEGVDEWGLALSTEQAFLMRHRELTPRHLKVARDFVTEHLRLNAEVQSTTKEQESTMSETTNTEAAADVTEGAYNVTEAIQRVRATALANQSVYPAYATTFYTIPQLLGYVGELCDVLENGGDVDALMQRIGLASPEQLTAEAVLLGSSEDAPEAAEEPATEPVQAEAAAEAAPQE